MNITISLTDHIKIAQIDFKKAPKVITFKVSDEQLNILKHMVHLCMVHDFHPVELLALREIRDIVIRKEILEQKKVKIKLPASYACTLFLCLNVVSFEDSNIHILSCRIVEEIYKQII